jgi:CMP-N-acetylneuraminic acid synthetase
MAAVLMELLPLIHISNWCLLQPTNPFRSARDVQNAIDGLVEGVDSVVSCERRIAWTSTDPVPMWTTCNGDVYVFRRDNLTRFGHLFGRTMAWLETDATNINTPEEWAEAEEEERSKLAAS